MRVSVDLSLCQTHAQCVFAAPEVFALDEDDELVYDATPADRRGPPSSRPLGPAPYRRSPWRRAERLRRRPGHVSRAVRRLAAYGSTKR
ncbi:ferredoxin [Nonomuraea jiangxiensis]|uniref:ferredoxin n=1 Tax=Nonomuraea jiangxiensis TaxID=633440 RepID=UPI003182E5BA